MRAEIEDIVAVKWLGSLRTSKALMKVDSEDTDIRVCIGGPATEQRGTCDSVVSHGPDIGSAPEVESGRGCQCRQCGC